MVDGLRHTMGILHGKGEQEIRVETREGASGGAALP